eukprot:11211857-Lingulodinium_polyedra.AAC.1
MASMTWVARQGMGPGPVVPLLNAAWMPRSRFAFSRAVSAARSAASPSAPHDARRRVPQATQP